MDKCSVCDVTALPCDPQVMCILHKVLAMMSLFLDTPSHSLSCYMIVYRLCCVWSIDKDVRTCICSSHNWHKCSYAAVLRKIGINTFALLEITTEAAFSYYTNIVDIHVDSRFLCLQTWKRHQTLYFYTLHVKSCYICTHSACISLNAGCCEGWEPPRLCVQDLLWPPVPSPLYWNLPQETTLHWYVYIHECVYVSLLKLLLWLRYHCQIQLTLLDCLVSG